MSSTKATVDVQAIVGSLTKALRESSPYKGTSPFELSKLGAASVVTGLGELDEVVRGDLSKVLFIVLNDDEWSKNDILKHDFIYDPSSYTEQMKLVSKIKGKWVLENFPTRNETWEQKETDFSDETYVEGRMVCGSCIAAIIYGMIFDELLSKDDRELLATLKARGKHIKEGKEYTIFMIAVRFIEPYYDEGIYVPFTIKCVVTKDGGMITSVDLGICSEMETAEPEIDEDLDLDDELQIDGDDPEL